MNSPIGSELQTEAAASVSDAAMIRLEDIAVRYRAPEERLGTFKEYAIRRLQRRVRYTDFYALDGIDLEIPRGRKLRT